MNKALFCSICSGGPFLNANGLRGHKQISHGVSPKPEGDRSQDARSLETRQSIRLELLENVVAQILVPVSDTYEAYCPNSCEEKLEFTEDGLGGQSFRCPTCHYQLVLE